MAENRFTEAAKKAAELTNKQLATELASVSTLSKKNIKALLPNKEDKEAFLELMDTVHNETLKEEKVAYLEQNAAKVGNVVFTLLKVLV